MSDGRSRRKTKRVDPDDWDFSRFDVYFIVKLLFLIAILICCIVVGVIMGNWSNGNTDNTNKSIAVCNDFNPCTRDVILPDDTCQHRPLMNGTDCMNSVCFNEGAPAQCVCGECVAPRHYCRGDCDIDDDCPDLPISPRLDASVEPFCFAHSCIYAISGGFTAQCESWIDFDIDNPVLKEGCLFIRQEDLSIFDLSGVCFFRYKCAPFDFRQIGSLDMPVNDIKIKMSQFDEPVTENQAQYISWAYSKAASNAKEIYDSYDDKETYIKSISSIASHRDMTIDTLTKRFIFKRG